MKKVSWKEAQEIIKQDGIFFLEFSTSWCGDCKMMQPIVALLEAQIKAKNIDVTFIEVDGEEASLFRDKNSEWEVLKVPSFFVIKNGIKKHIGYEYLPIEILEKAIIE